MVSVIRHLGPEPGVERSDDGCIAGGEMDPCSAINLFVFSVQLISGTAQLLEARHVSPVDCGRAAEVSLCERCSFFLQVLPDQRNLIRCAILGDYGLRAPIRRTSEDMGATVEVEGHHPYTPRGDIGLP
ncbi:hypothetical protein [Skermanella stibiiresistens]|nr:hypothetical protein [Skermanella stibiiresistens]